MTTFQEILEQKRMVELTAKRLNISFDNLMDALETNGLKLVVENDTKWTNTIAESYIDPPPFFEERT